MLLNDDEDDDVDNDNVDVYDYDGFIVCVLHSLCKDLIIFIDYRKDIDANMEL